MSRYDNFRLQELRRACGLRKLIPSNGFNKTREELILILVNADHRADKNRKKRQRKKTQRENRTDDKSSNQKTLNDGIKELDEQISEAKATQEEFLEGFGDGCEDGVNIIEAEDQNIPSMFPTEMAIKQKSRPTLFVPTDPRRTADTSKNRSQVIDGDDREEATPARKRSKNPSKSKLKEKTKIQHQSDIDNKPKRKPNRRSRGTSKRKIVKLAKSSVGKIHHDKKTINDQGGIDSSTNEISSFRSHLRSQFCICIPTDDIAFKPSRVDKLAMFLSAQARFSFVFHYNLTEWIITFGKDEKAAKDCFEHFLTLKYRGKMFRMELIGLDGEVILKCKKNVLVAEDRFDEDWVGFELLRRLDAYVTV